MLTPVIVDFEGYKCKHNQYVVKELAVASDNLDALVFKPPKDFEFLNNEEKRSYKWCTRNLHGIHWNRGNYNYSDLVQIATSIRLRHPRSQFYGKGTEKCAYLSSLLGPTVHNLEDLGCPKVEELSDLDRAEVCPIHCKCCAPEDQLLKHCALRKVILFSKWLYDFEDYVAIEKSRGEHQLIEEFDSLCSIKAQRSSSENHSES